MEPCKCEETKLVRRQMANGAIHFGTQCQRCGKWKAVAKSTLTPGQITFAVEFDDGISERFWQARQEDFKREREARSAAWWSAYNAYLKTERWRDKRARVLSRDNYTCQACLRRKASEVHHKTYEHCQNVSGEFGYEPLFDLESICEVCHRALTKLDRERRTA